MTQGNLISPKSVILLVLIDPLLIYCGFSLYIFFQKSKSVNPKNGRFSGNRCINHFQKIALPKPYYQLAQKDYDNSYDYILNQLFEIQKIAISKKIINFTILEQHGVVAENYLSPIMSFQKDVRNIVVTLSPINSTALMAPFLISSQISPQPFIPGLSINPTGASSMLELSQTLVESTQPLNIPIQLLFIGGQSHGLHGTTLYLNHTHNISGFLNLEVLCPRPPLIFSHKGTSSSVEIDSWVSKRGALVSTVSNDLFKTHLFDRISVSHLFKLNGLPGGEAVFFGKASEPYSYNHKIRKSFSSDLQTTGDVLLNFINNYDKTGINHDEIAIGISPFVLLFNIETAMSTTTFLVFSCSVMFIFFQEYNLSMIHLLKCFFHIIFAFIFILVSMIIIGLIILRFNPIAFVLPSILTFLLLFFVGITIYCLVMYFILRSNFRPQYYQYCSLLINIFLYLSTHYYDISLIFKIQLIASAIVIVTLPIPFFSMIVNFCCQFPFLVSWYYSYRTIMLIYMTSPKVISDLIPIILICYLLFNYTLIVAPISIRPKKQFAFGIVIV